MKTFPMFLKMAGRRVVIFGGGEQAAQKTRLMLKTEAEIVVAAEALDGWFTPGRRAYRDPWLQQPTCGPLAPCRPTKSAVGAVLSLPFSARLPVPGRRASARSPARTDAR